MVSGGGSMLELEYLEEERVRVLARFDELKARVTELEQQLQESKQEVGHARKCIPVVLSCQQCSFQCKA